MKLSISFTTGQYHRKLSNCYDYSSPFKKSLQNILFYVSFCPVLVVGMDFSYASHTHVSILIYVYVSWCFGTFITVGWILSRDFLVWVTGVLLISRIITILPSKHTVKIYTASSNFQSLTLLLCPPGIRVNHFIFLILLDQNDILFLHSFYFSWLQMCLNPNSFHIQN